MLLKLCVWINFLKLRINCKKQQQAIVQACWISEGMGQVEWRFPLKITFTRIGARKLDSDNLAGSGKAVRDQLAKLLNVNDGDESKVTWHYAQRIGKRGEYAVEIELKPVDTLGVDGAVK